MNRLQILFNLAVLLIFASCNNRVVTFESLLEEMTDKTAITYFPQAEYSLKQFSSYDRRTITPNNNDWWANADYTQFIRDENKDGRREFVLFDAAGPGAVVRYWMTFAGEGAYNGKLRIYLDESEIPAIEGSVLDILSGEKLATEPLASSVSPETDYGQRGHNLYLPIPYSNHCKITYECDAVELVNNRWRPSIYYNIDYRTYNKDVKVESFSMEVLERAKSLVEKTGRNLLNPYDKLKAKQYFIKKELASEKELTMEFSEKGRAISKISLKLDAQNINQALRSTVLSISFDGNETVWVPAGDFFGTGYQTNASKTWNSQVDENGKMNASWIMPYKTGARLSIINYGKEPVFADLEVSTVDYKWKKSSMYFGSSWHEYNRLKTAKNDSLENHEWHFDVNYIDLKGQGIYAGDALTVFNTVDAWWGEGDEKIYVDGEDFPSSIGTGTEDYYGYAWCRPEKFSHPFIAQPTGAGNFHPGMTVNMRYRSLDAIPFNTEISSNIEMWHWVKTKINFAMTTYWYAKQGFQSNINPDIETVQIPVALKRSDIIKPIVDDIGKIEGEHLEVMTFQSGKVSPQSGNFGWSDDSQLWWRFGNVGDELTCKFILNETGNFKVKAQITRAVDYGIIQLYINGVPVGPKINGFNKTAVAPLEINLGTHVLSAGENIFSVKILGADKNAKPGNMAGIDYILFTK